MSTTTPTSRLLMLLLSSAALTACGGGGGGGASAQSSAPAVLATGASAGTAATLAPAAPAPAAEPSSASAPALNATPAQSTPLAASVVDPGTPLPPRKPPVTVAQTGPVVTNVKIQNTTALEQSNVAVTFGQVFAVGDLGAAQTLAGKLADGTAVPLQLDVKARHADGSVRHAIVSASLPRLAAGQNVTLNLEKIDAAAPATAATPAALLQAGFTAAVHADLDGQRYSASADALLRSGKYTSWLAGPVANEWLVSGPLTTAQGTVHPHLTARFAIRGFGTAQARVDVTVENAWAFEPKPQNFLYDAQIMVGGQSVYAKPGLTHLNHARWRKVFWWGAEPAVHIEHNTAYLISTRAVPNYDQSVKFTEGRLADWKAALTPARSEPMAVGLANPYMPTTGGRDDLGIMPGWSATYLLSMDKRLKDVTLATADLAGSWSAHYRDKNTGRPVSLADYPYMTVLGHAPDTANPITKQWEAFPVCATATGCATPNMHDSSHQAGFAYLPYLVTGDYYYLEELQFWAMWNTFSSNPGYREFGKGLFKSDQVRGQAWSMRTLAEAAYISPDTDPLKKQLEGFLQNNIDWYSARYVTGSDNVLGVVTNGYAVEYNNGTGLAPWMDDFFTSAIGHAVELGYTRALPLLKWKATFPISRMTGQNFCWIKAGIYALKVRDTSATPLYATIGQAYAASNTAAENALACNSSAMATSLGLKVGEMTGYAGVHTGYPSNLQPALAYAADVGGSPGSAAWSVFMARTIKPNYGLGPQFAIVPR